MPATLQVRLFGELSIVYNDRPIAGISTSRSQALLAYLVLHRHAPQSRQSLAFQLWPDSTDTQARTNLRKELTYLRRELPEADQLLLVESKTLQWSPVASSVLDVMEFEEALKAAQAADVATPQALLKQAIALYKGDLLPSCQDEWIAPERERLQQQYISALEQLINHLQQQQDYRAALGYAQQLLRADAVNEATYCTLMRLYSYSGDRANALQVYHRCMTVLREELGVDPSATTRDLYQQILNEDEPPPAVSSATSPTIFLTPPTPSPVLAPRQDWGEAIDVSVFYGREKERSTLREWIVNHRCRIALLLGMGGIGKSSLAVKVAQEILESSVAEAQGGRRDVQESQLSHPPSTPPPFEFVIWRSLRNAPLLETLLAELVLFLSEQQDSRAETGRLIHWLKCHRCLVILDNVESIFLGGDAKQLPLQGNLAGQYRSGYENYGDLFRLLGEVQHQSCVLLTSREKPAEVAALEGSEAVRSLQLGGVPEATAAILEAKNLVGSEEQKQQLCQRYSNNPLAIKIVSTSIQDLFNGSIADFLSEDAGVFHGLYQLLDQQCLRSSVFEKNIMFWLAINRERTTLAELAADFVPAASRADLLQALESLSWRSLLETQSGGYTQPPIVMQYVTDRLIEWICDEIEEIANGEEQTSSRSTPTAPFTCSRLPKPAFAVPLLHSHALLKAQGKDYIQEIQIRQIVQPILHQLQIRLGDRAQVEQRLTRILVKLRQDASHRSGYAAGNVLNLLIQLKTDLTGYDLSDLALWQADLRNVRLHQVSLVNSDLSKTVFTETLSLTLAVAFSPDGQLLATGDTNRELRIWRVADGKNLLICQGHTNWIWSIAFSPDGQMLASSSDDKTIKLWDVQTGQCLQTLQEAPYQVWSIAFSPDSQLLATGSESTVIRLWSLARGECCATLEGHTDWVRSVSFSPNGQLLASGSEDGTVKLWNLKSGKCCKTLRGHEKGVWSVAFSPKGDRLASSSSDQTIKLWNVESGECLNTLSGHTNWVRSIAFSPDAQTLASGSEDQTVKLWQVDTGENFQVLRGHTSWVRAVAFSPDGQTLVSGGGDYTVKFWHFHSGQCWRTLQGYTNRVRSVAFSPTEPLLASGNDDYTVKLWDSRTRDCLYTLAGHTNSVCGVAFSADGQLLASGSGDQTIKLWSISSKQCLHTLEGHTGRVWSVAFSLDRQRLVSGSDDHTVKIWNVQTGQCLQTLRGHTSWVCSVALSPDGYTLASGSYDQTIKLWDIRTGKCLHTLAGHQNWVWSIAFSDDGQTLASGSGDHTVKLWDTTTGDCRRSLEEHSSRIWSVAFSPNGKRLASASSDQTVKLWEVDTGYCMHTLKGHSNLIWSIAFSPDSETLASGSQDETIKLWNIHTGKCLHTLRADRPYQGTNIAGAIGLTEAQRTALRTLGAVERDSKADSASTSHTLPLIGREQEWNLLHRWLTDDHRSEILLLLGEPGIGKTRLLEELATTVRANNGQVLWGLAFEAEMLRPYGVWIDALHSLPAQALADLPVELQSLFPEAFPRAEPTDLRRLFDAMVRLLSQLSANKLAIVILDNIQWLDEASAALLHYAARLLGHTRVRFACAARARELAASQPVNKLVQSLRRENRLQSLELPLLNQTHTVQLVQEIDWAIDGNQIFVESGGNPLFALEIARAIAQHGTACSESLEALIQERLQQLSQSTREFLSWTAVLGRSFNPTTIAEIVDFPSNKLLTAIEELEQEGIICPGAIVQGETQYDFVHDIVRQIAYHQMSVPRRRLMHRQIAQALKSSFATEDSFASEIAYHASLGGNHDLAASACIIAAERCLRLFAYAEASQLTERGLEHCQYLEHSARVRCRIELLKLHVLAGVNRERFAQLEAELHQLIEEARTLELQDEEATGFEVLIALNYEQGNLTSVQEHSLRAAERGRAASSTTTARMLAYTGWCLAETECEMPRAEALLLEAQSLAARVGVELIDIPCGLGCVRRHAADYPTARSLLHQAWKMAQAEQDHWRECACLTYLAMTELEASNPIAAIPYSSELAAVAAKISGEGSEGAFAAALDALARYAVGQTGAEQMLAQALLSLRQLDSQRMIAYTLTFAAEIDLKEHRIELAIDRAEAAVRAAQIVDHPSETALAEATLIRSRLMHEDHQIALELFEDLHQRINVYMISERARIAIQQLAEYLVEQPEKG
ncbi:MULTISPECIES: AAA family ATPase [unclassified Leptolyngbya]|uniref:WD40 domain-containing protein n=1 Tax=unclassified Leptolyngbya TaxID=2650499 RepID=UPI001685A63F|nr:MULTISPECIES: AAA family ATPase [unclassified Leptolyngbya]MBD1914100.1 AAA family ATPase [Leptolyngbya sp. FACHB-8]MBD2157303.1 AAA family ATPase [Leptolyngbya sp. FACHB-16]